jgi:hypothetical protein
MHVNNTWKSEYCTCIWTSNFDPNNRVNTHAKLKCTAPKSWPDHGGTIPAQHKIHMSSRDGMAPYYKAWRTLATAHFPCVLQWFLVFTLSESCVSHGFLSPRIICPAHVDAQDVPCLIVFGCTTRLFPHTSTISTVPILLLLLVLVPERCCRIASSTTTMPKDRITNKPIKILAIVEVLY